MHPYLLQTLYSPLGSQFLEHQDLVKASAAADAEDGGRRYKEQLDKIHMVVAN